MMPRRFAGAAQVTPYVAAHVTNPSVAQSSSSTRKVQPKRSNPRLKSGKRADEDARFNTGPRVLKLPPPCAARQPARRQLQNRSHLNPQNAMQPMEYADDIPDYPPPSFQEAMSTPSISLYPELTPYTPCPSPCPSPLPQVVPRSASVPSPQNAEALPSSPDETDSESSLEFIDAQEASDIPSDTDISPRTQDGRTTPFERIARQITGRDNGPLTKKRKNISLSPLRTFITSRHLDSSSSHTASPYSPLLGSMPLKTASSPTLSRFSPSAMSSQTSLKGDFLAPRRLFGKTKPKAVTPLEAEALDSWEVVPSKSQSSDLSSSLEHSGLGDNLVTDSSTLPSPNRRPADCDPALVGPPSPNASPGPSQMRNCLTPISLSHYTRTTPVQRPTLIPLTSVLSEASGPFGYLGNGSPDLMSPLTPLGTNSGELTPNRRHYHGRPLPITPSPTLTNSPSQDGDSESPLRTERDAVKGSDGVLLIDLSSECRGPLTASQCDSSGLLLSDCTESTSSQLLLDSPSSDEENGFHSPVPVAGANDETLAMLADIFGM